MQPFFAGIYTGNGPTENQTTRPSGGNQWFTLRYRFFHFGVGIVQNFIQNFLPYLGRRFWHRIISDWVPDDAVIFALIKTRVYPT
ncbi:Uncharacterised protein [Shigella sonnei]|nr:Uncharacterised protein [Shigella sonnei]